MAQVEKLMKPILPRDLAALNKFGAAGVHLLIDMSGATHLDDIERVKTFLLDSVTACGATLLDLKLHHFSVNNGITGVAMLSESHISIHTWPEYGLAAIDIFLCGSADPYKVVPLLHSTFAPQNLVCSEHQRCITTPLVKVDDDNE